MTEVSIRITETPPETALCRLAYTPDNLRLMRRREKMSQMTLARRAGLNRMTVQACERQGANPTFQVLLALGRVLNVVWTVDWQSKTASEADPGIINLS
jgi:DNA-binding XRE family transcriptional regulator